MRTARLMFTLILLAATALSVGASGPPSASSSKVPQAARSNISAVLGRDIPDFHVHPNGAGFEAANPNQKLATDFTVHGVDFCNGHAHWRMTLRGYGYGHVRALKDIAPRASINRVEYQRGPLTEWYLNGPVGLEQGFTLSEPPGNGGGLPLTIALDLAGNFTLDKSASVLSLTEPGGRAVLRYTGLSARDAAGKVLRTSEELNGHELLLKINDADAQYPVVVDPWVQLATLTASDGVNGDWLGYSVARSGNTVVVGAPQATVSQSRQGAAYVFVEPKSGWANMTETAKLTVFGGTANAQLGFSVTTNGDTVIAGAPGAASNSGVAYVFVKPKAGWKTTSKPSAKLLPEYGGGLFGISVAISGDAVIAGAPAVKIGSNKSQGVTFVFVKPKNGWVNMTPTAALTASDGQASDGLGFSVGASGDTVVGGAWCATVGGNICQGAAYVFVKPANGWSNTTQNAKLTASDGVASDRLAISVSIAGKTIAAGAPNKTVNSHLLQGAVYVFVEPVAGWLNMTQTAELTSSDGAANDAFGFGLSVNSDRIVAGAPFAQIGSNQYQGAAYVYWKPKNGWATTSKFSAKIAAAGGATGDNLGFSVTSSGDNVIASAPGEFPGNSTTGAAYVFEK